MYERHASMKCIEQSLNFTTIYAFSPKQLPNRPHDQPTCSYQKGEKRLYELLLCTDIPIKLQTVRTLISMPGPDFSSMCKCPSSEFTSRILTVSFKCIIFWKSSGFSVFFLNITRVQSRIKIEIKGW